jgi:hypothetical protein
MKQEERNRLRRWFESFDQSKQIDIAIKCIEELIYTESICFYESSKVPYWEVTGDRLDGSKFVEEDT